MSRLPFLGSSRRARHVLAARRHRRAKRGHVEPWEQYVPVKRLERELAEVVEPRLFEERESHGSGKVPGDGLGVVVEVDQQRASVTSLDEAVRVAVEARAQGLAAEQVAHVLDKDLASEVRDGPRLGGWQIARVPDREDIGSSLGQQRVWIRRHEVEL